MKVSAKPDAPAGAMKLKNMRRCPAGRARECRSMTSRTIGRRPESPASATSPDDFMPTPDAKVAKLVFVLGKDATNSVGYDLAGALGGRRRREQFKQLDGAIDGFECISLFEVLFNEPMNYGARISHSALAPQTVFGRFNSRTRNHRYRRSVTVAI
jgi:hypothetical protein